MRLHKTYYLIYPFRATGPNYQYNQDKLSCHILINLPRKQNFRVVERVATKDQWLWLFFNSILGLMGNFW